MNWEDHKKYYDRKYYERGFLDHNTGKPGIPPNNDNRAKLLIEIFNPRSVLDCGCATGALIAAFYNVDPSIESYGFDLADVAISNCIHYVRDRLLCLDVATQKLPYGDRHFDLVICFDILEHQHHDYLDGVIQEISRVCGRYLFIRQPFIYFIPYENREEIARSFNIYTHKERMYLIGISPKIGVPNADEDDEYDIEHPSWYKREYFIEKFEKNGFAEITLDEKYYIYPNDLGMFSFITLVMERT